MLYNGEIIRYNMTTISPDEYTLLKSLSGYELSLEANNIGRKYGLTGEQILALFPSNQSTTYDPSGNAMLSSSKQSINTTIPQASQFRFEYDPSPDASKRRNEVNQAVSCPGCGAGLGIPSIRPIKVTCPQCLHESTFNS